MRRLTDTEYNCLRRAKDCADMLLRGVPVRGESGSFPTLHELGLTNPYGFITDAGASRFAEETRLREQEMKRDSAARFVNLAIEKLASLHRLQGCDATLLTQAEQLLASIKESGK